jgi:hypothetical protein
MGEVFEVQAGQEVRVEVEPVAVYAETEEC